MTNYVDLDELRTRVYFEVATHDDRFVWEEIAPDPAVAQTTYDEWTDGFRRFRLVDCAHREVDRDGDLCTHCGHSFAYKAPTRKTTARKRPAK